MWQERKPLRSPVGSTLQKPPPACAQLFIPPALKHSRVMSGDPVDRTWKQRHNVRGFLKWPQPNLSAPTPPPPVCLNWMLLTLDFCCHAARLLLAHHFALQLLSLKAAVRTPDRPTVSGTAGIRPCFPGNGATISSHLLVLAWLWGLNTGLKSCFGWR